MQSPSSPGPAYSDGGTPSKGGFSILNSLKKALPYSPRPHSPTSSLGGSDIGTPPSRSKLGLPSFTNGQRKREVIKKLEEDLSLLQLQLHQRESELGQLRQQTASEVAARVDAQERLNMQYFKSHLLADMLVTRLLEIESAGVQTMPAATAAAGGATGAVSAAPVQSNRQLAAAKAAGISGLAPAAATGKQAAPVQHQKQAFVMGTTMMAESSFD